jgi:hypothetical protein
MVRDCCCWGSSSNLWAFYVHVGESVDFLPNHVYFPTTEDARRFGESCIHLSFTQAVAYSMLMLNLTCISYVLPIRLGTHSYIRLQQGWLSHERSEPATFKCSSSVFSCLPYSVRRSSLEPDFGVSNVYYVV